MTMLPQAERATRTITDGVVVVMPAYREADNLAATVEDFLTTLAAAGHDHRVVVVDDGSPDATGQVLRDLAARYPDRVIGVHHEVNQGYGAAVRTGIKTALERTDLRRVLLTDSDGQFKAADLLVLLRVQRDNRADGVIGYRRERADPLLRRLNGQLWTLASRLLLGTRSRDVDCAYKLLDRWLLEEVDLVGEAAAIDPELLAKVGQNHTRIIEHPVGHYPREHGRPTGASPQVIIRSLVSLARIYRDLVRDGHKWRRLRRVLRPRDAVLALLTLAAAVLSAGAFVYHHRQGTVLLYNDAISHVLISRRVIDSPTAGAAQLGGVWLPLPHLLALPLVWQGWMYSSGLAGSLVSMVSYVLTVRYVYLITAHMAAAQDGRRGVRGRVAGCAAAMLLALNPNVLYLQSTPMTELLLFACVAAAIHHLQQWCHTGQYAQLVMTAVATLLATLTRYEGWVLALAVSAVVGYTAFRRWKGYSRLESNLIFYGTVAFSGIVGWLGWNLVIFGDPMYWRSGEYADSSLWVTDTDRNVGDLGLSWDTYLAAMAHDIGRPTLALAAVGVVAHIWRRGLRASAVAPYVLLAFLPFFVVMLYAGQRPLHVPGIHGDSYNVRFGLVMALGAAVFAGYLVSLVPRKMPGARWGRVAVAAGAAATVVAVPGTATLAEPRHWQHSDDLRAAHAAAGWLRVHYDGGAVLMENFGNEPVMFHSGLPTGEVVYEASFRVWDRALADPAAEGIRWIITRHGGGTPDRVWEALAGRPALTEDYSLVYSDERHRIYLRKAAR